MRWKGGNRMMIRIMIVVALIIFQLAGFSSSFVFAETADEHRTVADSLKQSGMEQQTQVEIDGMSADISVEQRPFLLFVQLFGALIFVIALIYLLLRFLNKRTRSYRSTQVLQNLGGVPLGSNRSVQLVKVGERLLVVGVGDTIQLLKEIEQKDEIEHLLKQQDEQLEKLDVPITKFFQLLNRRRAQKESESELNFQDVLKAQLNDVKDSQRKLRDAIRERDH